MVHVETCTSFLVSPTAYYFIWIYAIQKCLTDRENSTRSNKGNYETNQEIGPKEEEEEEDTSNGFFPLVMQ